MEKLGRQAKDIITGFEGTITSKHSYLTGCAQYGITPKVDANGNLGEIKYFDESRIAIIGGGFDRNKFSDQDPGCDSRERP